MRTISKFIFFAILLAAVSCTNVASNEKTADGDSKADSNEKVSIKEISNKNSEAKPETEPTSTNSEAAKGTINSPDALIEQLYKQHDNENSPFFQDKNRKLVDSFFAKSLADMIWKDSVESKDEIGAIDFDPLFNAQDTEIAEFKVGKPEIISEKATVEVTFLNFGEKQMIKYLLTKENGMWKIEDIDYGEFTLAKLYKENLK